MPKHWKYVGLESRIYAEQPFAFGVVQPGQVVEVDEAPADSRWEKSSKAEAERQQKAAENEPDPEPVTVDPMAQPPDVEQTTPDA